MGENDDSKRRIVLHLTQEQADVLDARAKKVGVQLPTLCKLILAKVCEDAERGQDAETVA